MNFAKASPFIVAALLCLSSGLKAGELTFGMSTALSGPAEALGQEMKLGMEAYFHKVNKEGGINDSLIKLIALDDQYNPDNAGPNMRKLIDEHKVLAVVGNVGTPTAIVSVPIANQSKTLLYGAFTGAGVLRKSPPDRYVINYRASYAEETALMIDGLLSNGIKPEEIAFFTQNDGYGDAGYNGAVAALKAQGYADAEKLVRGRYERNTENVENGLATILRAKVEPKAIIMVGAYAPCAKFIKLAKQDLPKALFLNVSFVGSNALLKQLGADTEGVVITQVVPPYVSDAPGVKEYREALAAFKADAQPGFVSLEGYLAAKLLVEGLKKAGKGVTRESLIDALESLSTVDLGIDAEITLSKQDHQASHQVWPTVFKDGHFVPFRWTDLKTR